MNFVLNEKVNGKAARIIISAIVVLLGILSAILFQIGIIILPLLTCALAVLYLVESERKLLKTVISVAIILVELLLYGVYSINCLLSVIIAVLISQSFSGKWFNKVEATLLSTVFLALGILFMFLSSAMLEIDAFDFNLAIQYYRELMNEFKDIFAKSVDKYLASNPDTNLTVLFSPDAVSAMFDAYVNSIYSVIATISFLIVGLTCKILSFVISKLVAEKSSVRSWAFKPTALYGYFYLSLFVLQALFNDGGIFTIAVSNLCNFFAYILAYVGIGICLKFLRARFSKLSMVILVCFMIMFAGYAVNILSLIGALGITFYSKLDQQLS